MVTSESSASAESGEESSDLETLSHVKAKVRYQMQMLRGCEPRFSSPLPNGWEHSSPFPYGWDLSVPIGTKVIYFFIRVSTF